MRDNLQSDLIHYEIVDVTTLKEIHQTLMLLDILESDFDAAQQHLKIIGALEGNEAARLLTQFEIEAFIAATLANADLRADFRSHYDSKIAKLPWTLIGNEVKKRKGQAEMLTKNCLLGMVDQYLQPMVESQGLLNRAGAMMVINCHFALEKQLTMNATLISVLQRYIDQNRKDTPNIWPARSVNLQDDPKCCYPVTVGIWDTGIDVDLFTAHGESIPFIAYDMYWNETSGALASMEKCSRSVPELQSEFKGFFDLLSALDTDESQVMKQKFAALSKNEVTTFFEDFNRYASYSHGTHVAGIATAGNPMARLVCARIESDPKMVPHASSVDEAKRAAQAFQQVITFFKAQGARVVNMSWVLARSGFEHGLEVNGVGSTPEERKQMAREIFDVYKNGLLEAIRSAPQILFVAGAGNSNNNVAFDEFIPAMFELTNLMVVGVLDQAGEPTSFTSFGPTVTVYANGFEVESYVPGGQRLKLSGTSMAAPNVTNLAAKLLSLHADLDVEELISLILAGCEQRTHNSRVMNVLHPQRSVQRSF